MTSDRSHPDIPPTAPPGRVLVIGAGPVGLATALRLADRGVEVQIVEGGGGRGSRMGADLFGGVIARTPRDDVGDDTLVGGSLYADDHLVATRIRHPGGAANLWGAVARPGGEARVRIAQPTPGDLRARPTFDIPGFPAPAEEVLANEAAALDFFGLDGRRFVADRYTDEHAPIDLSANGFRPKVFHFARSAAIHRDRMAEVDAHPGIRVVQDRTLIGFERSGDRIGGVRAVDGRGEIHRLHGDHVVMALGGIENTRHLLLAAEYGEIPDPHDVLGRWFMDHPHTRLGYLTDVDPDVLGWYDFQTIDDSVVLRGHDLAPDVAEERDLLRFSVDLVGRHSHDATRAGYALSSVWDAVRRGDRRTAMRQGAVAVARPRQTVALARAARAGRVHHTGRGGWSDPGARLLEIGSTAVEAMFEQRPSPDNRIVLSDRRDRFGRRLPELHWQWSRIEVDSVRRSVEMMRSAFADAGAGELLGLQELGEGDLPRAGSGLHHMGGTRMHEDPAAGTVDGLGRHHQVENLTLVGSSVFCTSVGFANPTLAAVELAMWQADHLGGS